MFTIHRIYFCAVIINEQRNNNQLFQAYETKIINRDETKSNDVNLRKLNATRKLLLIKKSNYSIL